MTGTGSIRQGGHACTRRPQGGGLSDGGAPRRRPDRRGSASVAIAVIAAAMLLLGGLAAAPANAEELPHDTVAFSCSAITYTFAGFPNAPGNTVSETIYVDGSPIYKGTFSFDGPTGSNTVPISPPEARDRLDARAQWKTNGAVGGHDQPGGALLCEPDKYAALGDSFSSGEGAGGEEKYYKKTTVPSEEEFASKEEKKEELPEHTNQCHRAPTAYPALVARALYGEAVTQEKEVFKQQPEHFIFRACSGALMENMVPGPGQWDEWIEEGEEWLPKPAQDNWLTLPGGTPEKVEAEKAKPNPAIHLVTFSIGGNDAGFATILRSCIGSNNKALNEEVTKYTPAGCQAVIKEWEKGEGKAKEMGIPSIKVKLPQVLSNVHAFAPNAKIRVVLYPDLANLKHEGNIRLGKVKIFFYGETEFFFEKPEKGVNIVADLLTFENKVDKEVREVTTKWAAEQKVDAAPVRTETALKGHELGDAEPWVNALVFRPKTVEAEVPKPSAESFHPNPLGHRALARDVLTNLKIKIPEWLK
jgi:hypothetical protein